MKTYEVPVSCLKEKIGEIVPWDYKGNKLGENVFVVYSDGDVPVKIKSKLTKCEFDRIFDT